MQTINFIACMILLGFPLWAVLSPCFKDNWLLRPGLIAAALCGFAGLMYYYAGNYSAPAHTVFTNVAFALVLLSMIWRRAVRHSAILGGLVRQLSERLHHPRAHT